MKKNYLFLSLVAVGAIVVLASTTRHNSVREGFVIGTPEIKSISALTFGPDGILFIGDSKSASVFALDTKDNQKVEKASPIEMKQFDQKIAAALATVGSKQIVLLSSTLNSPSVAAVIEELSLWI